VLLELRGRLISSSMVYRESVMERGACSQSCLTLAFCCAFVDKNQSVFAARLTIMDDASVIVALLFVVRARVVPRTSMHPLNVTLFRRQNRFSIPRCLITS
jgi:hypothetical protein